MSCTRRKERSNALTPEEQTLAAIWFYATGSFQQVIGDIVGFSQPSVSRSVKRVSPALSNIAGQNILISNRQQTNAVCEGGFHE